jgi:small-conductance mechanosensitive channel
MNFAGIDFTKILSGEQLARVLVAALILIVGSFLARRSRSAVERFTQLDPQQRILLTKISYYGLLFASFAAALGQMGFDIRVLLGAAGVLTVAVGFAAQTSASNLISGLFLMLERPFGVGDVIQVGEITGEVMSIDLLSSKIRTFNNLMVRIPNETLVKTNITNHSYFPVRRFDFNLVVALNSDLRLVERVLRDEARRHQYCLEDPAPLFINRGFTDSGISIQFQVFTLTKNLLQIQNDLYRDIKLAFDRANIQIPFQTRLLLNSDTVAEHSIPRRHERGFHPDN